MKKRMLDLDILKLISITGVVLLHVMGNTIYTFMISKNERIFYNVLTNICFASIPLFVMISGVNFLNKDISIKELLKKYILKIILALIIFGLFYNALEIIFETHSYTLNDFFLSLKNILTGNLWAHMWYLYLIIAIYLITPVLRIITKNASLEVLKYFLIILFVFSFLIPELNSFFNINFAFYLLISGGYLFFYIYGYYIYYHKVSKIYKNISYLLGFISIAIIILLTLKNTHLELISYTSTLIFFVANSIFLFITSFKYNRENKLTKLINSIGKCSLGIYITHQIYINLIYKLFKIDWILLHPYTGLILYTLVVLFISYVFVYLAKKIKIIDKYII